jgi:N-acetylglucosaminyldiphosphoundecaprenol N-acetyl-beta-D-mannosaminyltransferase
MMRRRADILGVQVSAVNLPQAAAAISEWIQHRSPHYATVNPRPRRHGRLRDAQRRRSLNASSRTTAHGMATVWLLKLRGHRNVSRVYGLDLNLAGCGKTG